MIAYKRVVFTENTDPQKVYLLLEECIRSPQFAEAVTEFVFDTTRPLRRPPPGYDAFLAKVDGLPEGNEIALLRDAMAKLDLDDAARDAWVHILRTASPEYLKAYEQTVLAGRDGLFIPDHPGHRDYLECAAVLLLITCPNIKSFVYGDSGFERGPLQGFLRKNNYSLLPERYLEKLGHVTILESKKYYDNRFYTSMNFTSLLRLFHRLPGLQSVSVDGVYLGEGEWREEFPPGTSDMKEMHIKHSAYPSSALGVTIRIPRALEVLSLTTGRRGICGGYLIGVLPVTIGKALLGHKNTLRKLHIDLDGLYLDSTQLNSRSYRDTLFDDYDADAAKERDEWWDRDLETSTAAYLRTWNIPDTREYGSTIGSLHDFGYLKHLSIGIRILLDGAEKRDYDTNRINGYSEAPFRLIDALPAGLEHLTLRGYVKGQNSYFDGQVEEFMRLRTSRLPELRVVRGVDSLIPSSKDLDEDEVEYEVDSDIDNSDDDEGEEEDSIEACDEDGEEGHGFYERRDVKEEWEVAQSL
ncbi:putative f-box domain-containing protein [Paramyrothecium foliicola]|nr:putative f-box domain-containing protein [Paramyrothecium foliicola]